MTVTVNDKPAVAEVKVTKHGGAGYVYWTIYQKGGPALQTPLDIPLPAGAYDVHVKPVFDRRTFSMLEAKSVSLTIEADKQRRETVNFQVAHLTVSARQAGGAGLSNAGIGIGKGWEPKKLPALHNRQMPAAFAIAPGKHTIVVEDPNTRTSKQARSRSWKDGRSPRRHSPAGLPENHCQMDSSAAQYLCMRALL